MSNLDLMKAGIGLAIAIDIALTAVAGYTLFMTFGGIDGLTVILGLLVPALLGGLTVATTANVRRVAPKPRTRV